KSRYVSGEIDEGQRDRRRQRLHEQDAFGNAPCPVKPGDDDAEQEKYFDLEGEHRRRMKQPPDETGGEEAIVKPLIGGEHGGILRLRQRLSEGLEAERLRPQKHFQREKIRVQQR